MDGWMDGWMDGLNGWMDGWMDGWTDERTNRRMVDERDTFNNTKNPFIDYAGSGCGVLYKTFPLRSEDPTNINHF